MQHKLLSLDLMEQWVADPGQEASIGAEEESRRMVQLLRRITAEELTERQRECVLLYYFEEKKVEEVAHLLGISKGTVSKHLKKARARMERLLRYQFLGLAG